MRLALVPLLLLAACDAAGPSQTEQALAKADARAAEDGRIACALAGAATFRRECIVERVAGPEGMILTIRAPDGGFRRLLVTQDGRGVIAADGSVPAVVSVAGDRQIEVELDGDRYLLPATVK